MEPVNVEPLDLEGPDEDTPPDFESMPDVSESLHEQIKELKQDILEFKEELYGELVAQNTTHDPLSLGAATSFHSVYLHCLSFFIGILDNELVPRPTLSGDVQQHFNAIEEHIRTIYKEKNPDTVVLLYHMLFQLTVQHPFSFKIE